MSVGYEHWKRGNAAGAVSLLSQGVRRLRYHTSKPGVRELRQTARSDAEKIRDGNMDVRPPKVVCCIVGHPPRGPKSAIVVEVPAAKKGK